MKKQYLITIYITNYNYGKYIDQAIRSVLSQTREDFELIIIDDGSTDNSRNIIDKYKNLSKIKIIYQKNKGLNFSNNVAMKMAKGKYLMRLDADDYLKKNAIEVMSNLLESDNKLGLVFPDYYYVDSRGNITGKEKRHCFKKEVSLYDQPAHGACTMIRLEFLKKLGGYSKKFKCQDGYNLWVNFVNKYKVENINVSLFYYRRHNNNLTNNEDRILSTRRKINNWYVNKNSIKSPSTLAIIPVRKVMIGDAVWPFCETKKNESILENIAKKAANSKKIKQVIIVSEDEDILKAARIISKKIKKVRTIHRPPEYARFNESLEKTIFHVLDTVNSDKYKPELIMLLSLEYPFISTELMDDAINTLSIFKSDSLLSVRPDNKMYYQHNGHGMVPIMDQEKFTKLEREALYKGAGGIVMSTVKNILKNKKIRSGKIGHIILDEKSAFGVFSKFDLEIYKSLK